MTPDVSLLQNLPVRPHLSSVPLQCHLTGCDANSGDALDIAKHLALPLKEAHTTTDAILCVDYKSCLSLSISEVVLTGSLEDRTEVPTLKE
ncbi:hypothetical protein ACVIIV_003247 [Bradyrhizobium sp. USDA 4354]